MSHVLQAKGIASLIPEEGGVCSSTQVIYDHQTEDIEPFQQAVPRLKEDVVHQSLRVSSALVHLPKKKIQSCHGIL